jgi:hypothetical protein
MGTLHGYVKFMTVSRWIIVRIINVLDEIVEKIKTHILCSITFFHKSYHLWDNVEKCGEAREATDDNKIWRMRVACWISKATRAHAPAHAHAPERPHTHACTHTRTRIRPHTHAHARTQKYVILLAFPRQQRFRERALMLRYTYIGCLVWYRLQYATVGRCVSEILSRYH